MTAKLYFLRMYAFWALRSNDRFRSFYLKYVKLHFICAQSSIVDNFSTELTFLWAKVVFCGIFCYLEREKRLIDANIDGLVYAHIKILETDFLLQCQVILPTTKKLFCRS